MSIIQITTAEEIVENLLADIMERISTNSYGEKVSDYYSFAKDEGWELLLEERNKMLYAMPILMRVNFLLNSIRNKTDSEINWNKVNDILTNNVGEYDFNIFDQINTMEQLQEIKRNIISNSYKF